MAETQAAALAAITDIMEADIVASQRRDHLLAIQAELDATAAEIAEALEVVEVQRDDGRTETEMAVMALRARATQSAEMLESGDASQEDMAEAGVLSHSDLDDLEEEGLLEVAALQMVEAGTLAVEGDVHPLLGDAGEAEAPLREHDESLQNA